MLIGPKYKLCKRLGSSVFEKCQTQKFQLAEARAPRVRKGRGGSDYGLQLLEKQKARFTYGLSESQFSRYAHEAMEAKGKEPTASLLSRLESRLDNVVFRAGFAPTRRAARQMVSHGHIMVNGRRLNVPSYKVEEGDLVSVREGSRTSVLFTGRAEVASEARTPAWIELQEGGYALKVAATPSLGETEVSFNPGVVIQFYSR